MFSNALFLYPHDALRTGVAGRVFVSLEVSSTGVVRDVHVLKSSDHVFDYAAVEGSRRLSFYPCYLNGVPSDSSIDCEVDFDLDDH